MSWLKRNFWAIFGFVLLVLLGWLLWTMVREGCFPPELILGPIIVAVIGVLVVLPLLYISLGWLPYEVGKPLKGIRRVVFTVLSWIFFLASAIGVLVGFWKIWHLPVGPVPGYEPGDATYLVGLTAVSVAGALLYRKPAFWALRLFRK